MTRPNEPRRLICNTRCQKAPILLRLIGKKPREQMLAGPWPDAWRMQRIGPIGVSVMSRAEHITMD